MDTPVTIRDLVGHGQGLTPREIQIATIRASGASHESIAYLTGVTTTEVSNTLARPKVAMRVLAIEATIASGIAQGVEDLNVAIETAADEAFGVELVNMRDLHQMGMDICQETAPREKIKAKLGATAIAQDILDRAGKRAPTRVVQTNLSGKIPQEALDRMVAVMEENHDRTIEVRGSSTPAATSRDESGS